ncbi:MAG: hypothetical protein H0Z37_10825 [Firmicutes bacterium]|nr:hypothetical protein [Bacillota bacterium]
MADFDKGGSRVAVVDRLKRRSDARELLEDLREAIRRTRRACPWLSEYELEDVVIGPAGNDWRVIFAFTRR